MSSEAFNKINQIKGFIKEGIENKNKDEFNSKIITDNSNQAFDPYAKANSNYIEKDFKNFNSHSYNHKKNFAELRNNYNISNTSNITNNDYLKNTNLNVNYDNANNTNNCLGIKNQETDSNLILNDDTMQIINNQSLKNNLLNSNNSNNNSLNDKKAAKSSALRALLDEMKNKNNDLNEINENSNFNLQSKNIETRTDKLNNNFGLLDNDTNNYGDYSKTARTNNFISNDFNDNKLEINKNYINNTTRVRNFSVDSSNSNADMNFDDMKNEIDNLQSKIDGLEKKLRIKFF